MILILPNISSIFVDFWVIGYLKKCWLDERRCWFLNCWLIDFRRWILTCQLIDVGFLIVDLYVMIFV
jgi:hypothetical protein